MDFSWRGINYHSRGLKSFLVLVNDLSFPNPNLNPNLNLLSLKED